MTYKSHGLNYIQPKKSKNFNFRWLILVVPLILVACSSSTPQNLSNDSSFTDNLLQQLRISQPLHFYTYSQDIAGLQAVYDARVKGTTNYAIFMHQGSPDPYWICPTRGFPIAEGSELTNPERAVYVGNYNYYTIPQAENNGLYSPPSATLGTYVQCIGDDGSTYIKRDEDYVDMWPFPINWDYEKHIAVKADNSPPSFTVPFDAQKAANAVQNAPASALATATPVKH